MWPNAIARFPAGANVRAPLSRLNNYLQMEFFKDFWSGAPEGSGSTTSFIRSQMDSDDICVLLSLIDVKNAPSR